MKIGRLRVLLPGILVAATGVGAGDLLTASLGGSAAGLAILWAAVVGAVLKWFLNEGIARWQMATNTTLLEGWGAHLGKWIQWVFLVYFLVWTVFTGGALVNACGVAGTAFLRIGADLSSSKIIWGAIHAIVGFLLVRRGGFRVFSALMSASIAVMFVAVMLTAIMLGPDWNAVAHGLLRPSIPKGSLGWVLGILGGVGGTVTLLSYGYWIREEGRTGAEGLRACRVDLAVGYVLTALFGMAMVTIGSRVEISKGPLVALDLASQLESVMGPFGRWIFLLGFWGAVFSSLMGVWQSVPYLFADFLFTRRQEVRGSNSDIDLSATFPYRIYLIALTVVSVPMLWIPVAKAQYAYGVMGAFFMPLLALTLLILNNRTALTGAKYRNGMITNLVLVGTLCFFTYVGVRKCYDNLSKLASNEVASATHRADK